MKDYLWLAVEQDLNYCDVCECIIAEGVDGVPSKHLDSKHGSGRYGIGGDLSRDSGE